MSVARHAAAIVVVNLFAGVASAEPPAMPESQSGPSAPEFYQTMCVRTCDGFYFPIRQNAVREQLAGDAETCRSACQSDVRLFYFPRAGGNPATMIDLDGSKYAEQPNAFAFRSEVKAGCACRAAPWTEDAKARHRTYAIREKEAQQNRDALAASLAAARGAKATAEISAAATRDYFESDALVSGRAGRRILSHRPDIRDDAW